ncbi:hypothetical protein ABBQ32_003994 [Trebouxia sp. C0010 RCD-2024]
MAQTNFFGLTSYGAGTTYEKTIARPLLFHHVSDAVFVDLFRKHALGDSHLAIVLQVDGSTTMLTKDVLGLFQEALGRKPTVAEVNAVQTYFDTETSATISLPTFCKSLGQLKTVSSTPQSSCSSVSYSKYDDDKTRHHRVEYDPQSSFNCPVTTQQAIGWHTHKVLANDQDPRFPLSQTDVTQKEGRSVADYFGFLA